MCIQSKWGLAAVYLLNVSKTQLLIPVFAGQAEATRDSLWWFFFPNPLFAFGEKGMCLCIFFVSWLPDLCSCLHIWFLNALSVCLSLSEMSQRLQMFRVSFPVCLHICARAWALSVCSHILLCQLKRGFQVFIYPTEQSCRASSELRFAVSRAALPEAWAGHLGEGCSSTSEQTASHLNTCIQSCLTK